MISVEINNFKYEVNANVTVLVACKTIGVEVPQYCYHESLSIAGNCRMCLIEVEETDRTTKKFVPLSACSTDFDEEDTVVFTDSLRALKSRESVAATLLVNHPLDCPICDQAGDCDLQDQSKNFGQDISRYLLNRRAVLDKDCGILIKTIMTRCIHCTRCVRFGSEVAGVQYFGTINRGSRTDIGTYVSKYFFSEVSGNVIDLCPVGALTSNSFKFKARSWELKVCESVDTNDSVGSSIQISHKGSGIARISAKYNANINQYIISDITRFSYDTHHLDVRIKDSSFFNIVKNRYIRTKAYNIYEDIILLLKSKNSFPINISFHEEIGFANIEFLTRLTNQKKNIFINSLNSIYKYNNYNIFNLEDKILDVDNSHDFGLILGFNPRVECSSLNIRLRRQYRQSSMLLLGIGLYYYNNIDSNVINLNLKKSFDLFEGKYLNLSTIFLFSVSPLILISDNFFKRGLDFAACSLFLKSYFNTLKILKVAQTGNSNVLSFLNIKNISKQYLSHIKKVECISFNLNQNDTVTLRRLFLSIKNKIVWLNSYFSNFTLFGVKYIVPTLTDHESERIFLNLENRFQLIKKITNSFFSSQKIPNFFKISLLLKDDVNILKGSKNAQFLNEFITFPLLFDQFEKKFLALNFESKSSNLGLNFVYLYPIKVDIADFQGYTKNARNSELIQKVNNDYKKKHFNFFQQDL